MQEYLPLPVVEAVTDRDTKTFKLVLDICNLILFLMYKIKAVESVREICESVMGLNL